jgi:hypothetical protein
MNNNDDNKYACPLCKSKLIDHSELQYQVCDMIIKQFAIT